MDTRKSQSDEMNRLRSKQLHAPLFQQNLRRAILNVPSKSKGSPFSFMKKLLPVGLVLALLLMFNAVQKSDSTVQITPTASAQELVEDVLVNLQGLSDAEMQVIKDRLEVEDVFALLNSARSASDLKYASVETLSCQDVETYSAEPIQGEHAFDFMIMTEVDLEAPECTALLFTQELAQDSSSTPLGRSFRVVSVFDSLLSAFGELTYLQFISSDGVVNILGVDEDFIPIQVFRFGAGALPDGASFTVTSTSTN